jgi:hypothetical protein
MDWFKRYGIPGAYTIGLTLVWLMIWYPCKINLKDEETLKIVAGIFAGGFLPLGYLLCMVSQGWYFFWCTLPCKFGLHSRALLIYKENHKNDNHLTMEDWATWAVEGIQSKWPPRKPKCKKKNGKCLWFLAQIKKACSKLATVLSLSWVRNLSINKEKEIVLAACVMLATVSKLKMSDLETYKYVQEWIRKRTDIVVMNQAIMVGTIVSTIGAFCLCFSSAWTRQPHYHTYWICFLLALVILFLIILYVTIIFRIKINIVLAGMIELRKRPDPVPSKETPNG